MSEKFDLVMEYFGKMAGKLLMTLTIMKMTTMMMMVKIIGLMSLNTCDGILWKDGW